MPSKNSLSTTPSQIELPLDIAAEREINGVGMGVLTNGVPFLTLRGLARMCGVDHSMIVRISEQWFDTPLKRREKRIKELVREQNADDSVVFFAIEKNGTLHHAVPDAVCMAILEYYAFEAKSSNEQALKAYRTLAKKGFSDFIYSQVGYNPTGEQHIAWKQFQDRVSLTYSAVPAGYFCIFKEIAEMFVTLIYAKAEVGPSFVPDISVGMAWSKYWKSENLDAVHGMKRNYIHHYPSYFPQAVSNPQQPLCYPEEALGEFRKWFRETYLVDNMPKYISSKVKEGMIQPAAAATAIGAFKKAALTK